MRVINGRPPLFDEIDAAFNVRGKPILFSWGDVIYRPQGTAAPVHPSLVAHEQAHGARQGTGAEVERWWRRYIADPEFRLAEEIIGHRAEFEHLCRGAAGRLDRRRYLAIVAAKLAAPLYGRLITTDAAKRAIGG